MLGPPGAIRGVLDTPAHIQWQLQQLSYISACSTLSFGPEPSGNSPGWWLDCQLDWSLGPALAQLPLRVQSHGRAVGGAGLNQISQQQERAQRKEICSAPGRPLHSSHRACRCRMCTGKGPGAKCRVGIALSPNSAPASPTTPP